MLSSPSLGTELDRSHSATSIAASVTTYHSFHDMELFESLPSRDSNQRMFKPTPMRRQDSGYASIPSGSQSGGSQSSSRRISTASSNSSSLRPRTRPSFRRAAKSTPNPRASITLSRPPQRPRSQQQSCAYFQFPSMEGHLDVDQDMHDVEECHYPPPPQTTHYWTSDNTRRLEYAAIDAARNGIRGWVLKYVIPDCFVPKRSRRLGFDDEGGSVRRYRIELESDDTTKEGWKKSKKMGWLRGRS
ncbi:hypothetical protein E8E14_000341 [Neopestalotiopsis sp. 37M]|nr:hypothetical protein E8E14_000341 [Neopestalotiopsis sp. 37M]